eukprot:m.715178 g.715178  ORF g.715178 m.715178 type:complete len:442 (+) comp22978_c0_seq5:227-1552(+)
MPPRKKQPAAGNTVSTKTKAMSRSPAEFFADNKSIAGFDNPGKSTFTAIREFIENSLDASEEARVLPDIHIQVDAIPKSIARPDLYGKNSPVKGSKQDALERALEEEAANFEDDDMDETADGEMIDDIASNAAPKPASKKSKSSGKSSLSGSNSKAQSYYRVTVRDNGLGMPHSEVPNMLARVLSGSKYGVQQARGRFGLGAKMALIWSKMTTAGELVAYTAQKGRANITFCKLDIDLHKNEPKVKLLEKLPNDGTTVSEILDRPFPPNWHGAEVSVMFEGNWVGTSGGMRSRPFVIKYLRNLAVITPYAQFTLHYNPLHGVKDKALRVLFQRRSEAMPPIPKVVKHHPLGVGLTKIEELVRQALEHDSACDLKKFLMRSFSFVTTKRVLCPWPYVAAAVIHALSLQVVTTPTCIRTCQLRPHWHTSVTVSQRSSVSACIQ